MASDAERARTVAVPPRRAAAAGSVVGRAVRRLLVLGGLLIAGWLLGCAAQSAHADEVPATPSHVVETAPALEHAVEAATERPPVPDVVQAMVENPPPPPPTEAADEPVPHDAVPLPTVAESVHAAGDAPVTAGVTVPPPHRWTPKAVSAQTVEKDGGQNLRRTVRHHPAPAPAPQRPDDHSVAGGAAMSGVTAGFPSGGAWAPVPMRGPSGRLPGAVPPAVRTAADEPSFAPD
ncbi:hypothetical protein [Actinomadura soli]|uniref:hypothetical protein n=1 Tax=Actinomadura soli TaxID=2508997 RepID=UPI001487342B|nr:hypothetical protein [Actinomadura soli]